MINPTSLIILHTNNDYTIDLSAKINKDTQSGRRLEIRLNVLYMHS